MLKCLELHTPGAAGQPYHSFWMVSLPLYSSYNEYCVVKHPSTGLFLLIWPRTVTVNIIKYFYPSWIEVAEWILMEQIKRLYETLLYSYLCTWALFLSEMVQIFSNNVYHKLKCFLHQFKTEVVNNSDSIY